MPTAKHDVPTAKHDVPTAKHDVPTAKHDVPTANHDVPTANHDLPTAKHDVPTANHDLPTAKHDVPTANHDLPTANHDLPTAKHCRNMSSMALSGSPMFIRIAEVKLLPTLAEEARRIYAEQAAPRVQSVAGNSGCYMLEPVDESAPHLACTLWNSEASARAYESSGEAKQVADLIRHAFAGPPRLLSYRKA